MPPKNKTEMQPVIVVLIAACLLFNGYESLDALVHVPMLAIILPAIPDAMEMSDEQLAESEMTREEAQQIESKIYRMFAGFFLFKILHMVSAASMLGLLLWRGYAIYYAVASALLMMLAQYLTWDITFFVQLNAACVAAIVWMLRFSDPDVWARLNRKRT